MSGFCSHCSKPKAWLPMSSSRLSKSLNRTRWTKSSMFQCMSARLLRLINILNIPCGGLSPWKSQNRRREGHDQNLLSCGACLCACYTLWIHQISVQRVSPQISQNRRREGDEQKPIPIRGMFARLLYSLKAYIRVVFSLTIYLKMRHKKRHGPKWVPFWGMFVCLPHSLNTSNTLCGGYSPQISRNQQNKAAIKLKYSKSMSAPAEPHGILYILRGGLLPVSKCDAQNVQNAGFQNETDIANVWLLCLKVKSHAHQTKTVTRHSDVCACWAL